MFELMESSLLKFFKILNYLPLLCSNLTHLNAIRRAASCIAEADLIDKQVRSNGGWSLLPEHGMLSCALPAMHLEGHMTSQLQFPAWLGKNSSGNKRQRMMRLLASHSHLKCVHLTSDTVS